MDMTQSGSGPQDDQGNEASGGEQDTAAFQAGAPDIDDQDAEPTMTAPGDARPDGQDAGSGSGSGDRSTTDIDQEIAEGGGGR